MSEPKTIPKTVIVMRHAKAEQDAPTDFERCLAERGHADAADAGRWLAGRDLRPDRALVSAASRTHQTWDALAAAAGYDGVDVDLNRALYGIGPVGALDLLRELEDGPSCVLVVGHNPTMASLATVLDDGEGTPEASTALVLDFPTSALAVFTFTGDWADLGEASARLVGYYVGRG